MSEFKGTKGNWKSYESFENQYVVSTMDGRGLVISTANSNPHERKANALLISKAPEMLEMLKRVNEKLLSLGGENTPLRIEIENLIKEATEL